MALNRAALLAEVDSNWADNTSGNITPAISRSLLSDILNNVWTLQDAQTVSGSPITFVSIALGLSGILYGNGASSVSALSPGQIPGSATNDSATAGNVGEYITATGTAVSLTTATVTNITSILLSAGDWDVWGEVWFNPAASTTISEFAVGSSSVSGILPTPPAGGLNEINATFVTGSSNALPVGVERYSVAGPTVVYLVALAGFAVSTMAATGKIAARRAR
jgi:hypothetical protein